MMAPPRSNSPYRLLVEGQDDKYSIIALLNRHGLNWDDDSVVRPYVHESGGIDKLLEALQPAIKSYDRVGIIVDADDTVGQRWEQVRSRLESLDLEGNRSAG